jgi:hypothetical protein
MLANIMLPVGYIAKKEQIRKNRGNGENPPKGHSNVHIGEARHDIPRV